MEGSTSSAIPSINFVQGFRAVLNKLREGGPGIEVTDESFLQGLEVLHTVIEAREKDYRTAAEVGQMLVERNKLLMEKQEESEAEWEEKFEAQKEAMEEISNSTLIYEQRLKVKEEECEKLRSKANENKVKYELLQAENMAAIENNSKLQEECEDLSEQLKANKLEAKAGGAYREKTRQLFSEIDQYKDEISSMREEMYTLTKTNKSLIRDMDALKETSGADQILQFEVQRLQKRADAVDKLKESNNRLKEEIRKLRIETEEVQSIMSENENLTEVVNSLMKANKHFRVQQEEDRRLLADTKESMNILLKKVEDQKVELNSVDSGSKREYSTIDDQLKAHIQAMVNDPSAHADSLRSFLSEEIEKQLKKRKRELQKGERELQKSERELQKSEREIQKREREIQQILANEKDKLNTYKENLKSEMEEEVARRVSQVEERMKKRQRIRSKSAKTHVNVDLIDGETTTIKSIDVVSKEDATKEKEEEEEKEEEKKIKQSIIREGGGGGRIRSSTGTRGSSKYPVRRRVFHGSDNSTINAIVDIDVFKRMARVDSAQYSKRHKKKSKKKEKKKGKEEEEKEKEGREENGENGENGEKEEKEENINVEEEELRKKEIEQLRKEREVIRMEKEERQKREQDREEQQKLKKETIKLQNEREALSIAQEKLYEERNNIEKERTNMEQRIEAERLKLTIELEQRERQFAAEMIREKQSIEDERERLKVREEELSKIESRVSQMELALSSVSIPHEALKEEEGKEEEERKEEKKQERTEIKGDKKEGKSDNIIEDKLQETHISVQYPSIDEPEVKVNILTSPTTKKRVISEKKINLIEKEEEEDRKRKQEERKRKLEEEERKRKEKGEEEQHEKKKKRNPEAGETLHRLLFSSLNLAGALDDISRCAVNHKTTEGHLKMDYISRHIIDHLSLATIYAEETTDDLRQAQIANAISQIRAKETYFHDCVDKILSPSTRDNPIVKDAFHKVVREISSANNEIATACTLCFLSKTFESVENVVASNPSLESILQPQKAKLLDLAPQLVISSKLALGSPKSGAAKTKLLQMLDRTEQTRLKLLSAPERGEGERRRGKEKGGEKLDIEKIKEELRAQIAEQEERESEDLLLYEEGDESLNNDDEEEEDEWNFLDDLYSKDEQTVREEFIKLKRQMIRIQREEKKHIRMVMSVREKLNDSNLALMHKTMRSVLSFRELLQLSNACINNALKESRDMFKIPGLPNPSLMALCIDLLMEVALLMKRNNDFSEGINDPTLRKLEKFNRDFERKESEKSQQHRKSSGGILSFLGWGRK